jgi:molybdopterin molybdotransferase
LFLRGPGGVRFDAYLKVDWSARSKPAPARPSPDAIWLCLRQGRKEKVAYCRTRTEAEILIHMLLAATQGRILAGFDFSFAWPGWFHERLGRWDAVWARLEREIEDTDTANNRFEVAAALNRELSGRPYPFWGTPKPLPFLSARRVPGDYWDFRHTENLAEPRAQSSFKLFGAGSVGSQSLLGIPVLERLRRRFRGEICVWPFERPNRRIVLAEAYPSMLTESELPGGAIRDERQVKGLARFFQRHENELETWLERPREMGITPLEGWILGVEP